MATTSHSLPGPEVGPTSPTALSSRQWRTAALATVRSISREQLTDRAAALTYYGVLSMFPALLVLVSVLGLLSDHAADTVVREALSAAPAEGRGLVGDTLNGLRQSQTAGLMAFVGVLGAIWAASGYLGAFMRAANAVYHAPEGRPWWKTAATQVGLTILVGAMALLGTVIVVVSGPVARYLGDLIGLGSGAVTAWSIVKWPVLILLVGLIVAVLYRGAPNIQQGGFRWVSPGGLLAVLLWAAASAAFSLYVSHFGSYNKTYGTVGGIIVFLTWLWLTNVSLLVGTAFDAQLERARIASAGFDADREPFLRLRDDRSTPADPPSANTAAGQSRPATSANEAADQSAPQRRD